MTRRQYDESVQDLVGLEVAKVTYFEIEYETPERCYLHLPSIGHFLDFGLELGMTCGTRRSFLWDGTFYQYGIGVYPHEAAREVSTNRRWVVTDTPEWEGVIGYSIAEATTYWSWAADSETCKEADRTYFPQDLRLAFSSGKHIYLSASQYMEKSDSLFGMSDEVLVVFEESVAAKYRIGPYANGEE